MKQPKNFIELYEDIKDSFKRFFSTKERGEASEPEEKIGPLPPSPLDAIKDKQREEEAEKRKAVVASNQAFAAAPPVEGQKSPVEVPKGREAGAVTAEDSLKNALHLHDNEEWVSSFRSLPIGVLQGTLGDRERAGRGVVEGHARCDTPGCTNHATAVRAKLSDVSFVHQQLTLPTGKTVKFFERILKPVVDIGKEGKKKFVDVAGKFKASIKRYVRSQYQSEANDAYMAELGSSLAKERSEREKHLTSLGVPRERIDLELKELKGQHDLKLLKAGDAPADYVDRHIERTKRPMDDPKKRYDRGFKDRKLKRGREEFEKHHRTGALFSFMEFKDNPSEYVPLVRATSLGPNAEFFCPSCLQKAGLSDPEGKTGKFERTEKAVASHNNSTEYRIHEAHEFHGTETDPKTGATVEKYSIPYKSGGKTIGAKVKVSGEEIMPFVGVHPEHLLDHLVQTALVPAKVFKKTGQNLFHIQERTLRSYTPTKQERTTRPAGAAPVRRRLVPLSGAVERQDMPLDRPVSAVDQRIMAGVTKRQGERAKAREGKTVTAPPASGEFGTALSDIQTARIRAAQLPGASESPEGYVHALIQTVLSNKPQPRRNVSFEEHKGMSVMRIGRSETSPLDVARTPEERARIRRAGIEAGSEAANNLVSAHLAPRR